RTTSPGAPPDRTSVRSQRIQVRSGVEGPVHPERAVRLGSARDDVDQAPTTGRALHHAVSAVARIDEQPPDRRLADERPAVWGHGVLAGLDAPLAPAAIPDLAPEGRDAGHGHRA